MTISEDPDVTQRRPIVLVVEDDIAVSSLLVNELHDGGFMAFPVGTVAEAVDTLAAGLNPAAILLDLNLPNGHGMDAANALLNASGDRTCFFIYTGDFNLDFSTTFYDHFNGRLQGFWIKGDVRPAVIPRMIRTGIQRCRIQQRLIQRNRAEAVKTTPPITGESYASTLVRKTAVKVGGLRTWEKLLPFISAAVIALGGALVKMTGWSSEAVTPEIIGLVVVGLGTGLGAYYTARLTEKDRR